METAQWKFYFKHNRKKQYLDIRLQRSRVRFCTNAETSYSMKRYLAGYFHAVHYKMTRSQLFQTIAKIHKHEAMTYGQ